MPCLRVWASELFFEQRLQNCETLGPFPMAAISIDMTGIADGYEAAAPKFGATSVEIKAGVRIITARNNNARKRQAFLGQWCKPLCSAGEAGTCRIRNSNQKRAADVTRCPGRPLSNKKAGHAVGNQYRIGSGSGNRLFKVFNPVGAYGGFPITLFDALE